MSSQSFQTGQCQPSILLDGLCPRKKIEKAGGQDCSIKVPKPSISKCQMQQASYGPPEKPWIARCTENRLSKTRWTRLPDKCARLLAGFSTRSSAFRWSVARVPPFHLTSFHFSWMRLWWHPSVVAFSLPFSPRLQWSKTVQPSH